MTMRAQIISSDFTGENARFLIGNEGMSYNAAFPVSLGKHTNFVRNNAYVGRRVFIEFSEAADKTLILKSMDFIKE